MQDLDATINAENRFACVCPPGLLGDGVSSCDLPKYQTQLTLAQPGVTVEEFDNVAFKNMLYDSGALPAGIDPNMVLVTVKDAAANSGRRRRRALLQEKEEEGATNSTQEDDMQMIADGLSFNSVADDTPAATAAASAQGRRLLQTSGIQITVTIYSESQTLMSNVTSSINTSALDPSTGFTVTQQPSNYINPYQVCVY